MNPLEYLFVGLILAGVSALAAIAYQHPAGFKKLALPIMLLFASFGLLRVVGDFALAYGILTSLHKFIGEHPDSSSPNESIVSLYDAVRDLLWTVIIVIAVEGYLSLLWWLPAILGHTTQEAKGATQGAVNQLAEPPDGPKDEHKPVKPTPKQKGPKP